MEEKEVKEKKVLYKKWWFWGIIIVFIMICLFTINSDEKTEKVSSNDVNTLDSLDKIKQNYNQNIKLKENPYKEAKNYDGIYEFSLESDNGSGHMFTAIGVMALENGKCKIKYETGSDTFEKVIKQMEGFYGLNQEDNFTFYFSLNDDYNYELKTYKCEPNEKNLSCELKSTYDLAGCSNNELNLIYSENQNLNELNTIFSQVLEREEEKRIKRERAQKEQKEQEFKKSCKKYSFEQLARNPDKMKDKKVKVTGEVIQVSEGIYTNGLRVNITKNEYDWYEDTIYVTYVPEEGKDKILEDDIITVWGTAEGEYSYTSVMGATITLPYVSAEYLEIE